jgi:phage terminase large subunit-like protein
VAKRKSEQQNIPALAQKFMLPTSHYDEQKASYVEAFIAALRHTKAEWKGQSFVLLPWQADIIRTVFGVIGADGYRQFRTCYVEIGKKNGKTMLAAALALYLLIADKEFGAEIYSCAADRQQASLIYREAAEMAKNCPALAKRVKVLDSQKRISYKETNSFYQVLSSEGYSKHGINPHAVLYDETHVADREMFRVMTHGSSDARRQPLHLFITTAGNNTHSVGYELHQKALDIRDGRKIDSSFLPIIYAAETEDDWTDPKTWTKANPSMGVTIPEDSLRRACESAQQNPTEENSFRQLRLCQWTQQAIRWMPMHVWDACSFPVNEESLIGKPCYAGLDLSSTTDITALVLVFPPTAECDKYQVLPYFWLPEDNIDLRVRRDHVPYDIWRSQGLFNVTEGNCIHYEYIENFIERLRQKYDIRELAFDRWGSSQIMQSLQDNGLTVVPFGQGYRDMSPPTKDLMRLVLSKQIAHGGNVVLRWMMDNVCIQTDSGSGEALGMDDAGNIKPSKAKSNEKIDGVVSLIMGLARALVNDGAPKESIYDNRGILWL